MASFASNNAVLENLKKLQLFSPDEFGRALYAEAEVEAKECKRQCPVDTGELRASIHVEGPTRSGDQRTIRATIIAGGPGIEYALIVHEDLEAFHRVGNAKYIEAPLAESSPYMAGRVAARIDLNKAL